MAPASNKITDLVETFARLEEARARAIKEAREAELDPAALQRAARSTPASVLKRQVQTTVDHQFRFLANRESQPATIPPESDLARVAALCAKGMSARDIAKELGFGKSKAGKLMQQAQLFGVRISADADSAADDIEIPKRLRRKS
jgi:hypothetical protein